VTCRFTVAMLRCVTWAMASRAIGPRCRAAPNTEAAAASATRSEGATMWCRANSARFAWAAEPSVVVLRTGLSFVKSAGGVCATPGDYQQDGIVRNSVRRGDVRNNNSGA
jgi:hypothetical protein